MTSVTKILIVEDEFAISQVLKAYIVKENFEASEPHPPNQDLEGASIDLNTPYKQ